jgi:Lon protease-like protein
MSSDFFSVSFETLPPTLPLFPLADAIVMPGCQLPLNVFEPRYLDLVVDTLKEERLIGMVQPDTSSGEDALYRTGTAGRIVCFNELPDRRLFIILGGVCRFDIVAELPAERRYRQAMVSWSRFRQDIEGETSEDSAERERFMLLLRAYSKRHGFKTDWSEVEDMPLFMLVNALAGQLPLDALEKQSLVEAVSQQERVSRFIDLLAFEVSGLSLTPDTRH